MTDAEFFEYVRSICPTKAAFATAAEAKAMMRRHGFKGKPYACPFCNYWHITSFDRVMTKRFNRRLRSITQSLPLSLSP